MQQCINDAIWGLPFLLMVFLELSSRQWSVILLAMQYVAMLDMTCLFLRKFERVCDLDNRLQSLSAGGPIPSNPKFMSQARPVRVIG